MSDREIVEGLQILCKGHGYSIAAEHDEIHAGMQASAYTLEERQVLCNLGWFISVGDCEKYDAEVGGDACLECESCLSSNFMHFV